MSKHARPSPTMNVTPLVDVVLVLLIIFMIVIPSMEHEARVDLPEAQNPDQQTDANAEPLLVSMTAANEIYVDSDHIDRASLPAVLSERHAREPNRKLVLRADRTLDYGTVREVFAVCQRLAFPGLSLRVSERTQRVSERTSSSQSNESR